MAVTHCKRSGRRKFPRAFSIKHMRTARRAEGATLFVAPDPIAEVTGVDSFPPMPAEPSTLATRLSHFPRLGLAQLPTPLEPMRRLTEHLRGPRLWVK